MEPTIENVVDAYRKLRDKKKEIKEEHVLQLRPYNDRLESMESWLSKQLLTQGVTSMKTPAGTAYKTETAHVKVVDREVVLGYILESGDTHMLDLKINSTAADEYLTEQQVNYPGTELTRRTNIRVRK
jgi:hypothetical protein